MYVAVWLSLLCAWPASILGSTLIYLVECGAFGTPVLNQPGIYIDRLAPALLEAHRDFMNYKKLTKLACTQPRFTPARLSRRLQSSCFAQLYVAFPLSFEVL